MDSSLILSVARCDLGRALDLLCEGASPDLVTRAGSPLLHLALGHEDPEAALAMAQLLLVHGGRLEARDPGTGLTALEAAQRLGRGEIVSLLRSYGGMTSSDLTKTTFQKYIFDDVKTQARGNNFLEEVANLFEDNISVQFNHRLLAQVLFVLVIIMWLKARNVDLRPRGRLAVNFLVAVVLVQVALGITTLLLVIPIALASVHQAGAVLVFMTALWATREINNV